MALMGVRSGMADDYVITANGLTWSPDSVIVNVGDTVTFNFSSPHSVIQTSSPAGCSLVGGGFSGSSSFTTAPFTTGGIYYFACGVSAHCAGGMRGSITVIGPTPTATATPTPSPTPFADASIVSHTLPTEAPADHAVPVTIRIQNTGNTTWTNATGYDLEMTTDSCSLAPAPALPLFAPPTVIPGQIYDFTFSLTAPGLLGPCSFGAQMSQGVSRFGSELVWPITVVSPINNANVLNNTIPLTLWENQGVAVDVTVRNTGNTTWVSGGNYSLKANDDLCGLFSVPPQLPSVTSPNTNAATQAYIIAPPSAGTCAIELQMEEQGVGSFGGKLNLTINVIVRPNRAKDWTVFE